MRSFGAVLVTLVAFVALAHADTFIQEITRQDWVAFKVCVQIIDFLFEISAIKGYT